jgi:hypothetical protein
MIKIVYWSETVDNWGRTESSSKPQIIYSILKDSDNFSDDMVFEGPNSEVYFIDDLIGKEVIVEGFEPFIVTE